MKTKPSVQRSTGNRVLSLCLALAMLVVVAFVSGEALVTRFGRVAPVQADEVQAPNLSLGDVLAAIR